MSERIASLIFLNIYTPADLALIHIIIFVLKYLIISKLDLKFKEALHLNWRKPNLNVQQYHLALTLSL